ncbi:extracellular solute-binding protein [Bifidobacterium sp. ESL0682]|uniref:ABC transporter substrate-binding protein n=1 Tax=Bifidobacterium sp. ESL0682 TaxID=2983212 RepID=UPI0023F78F0F|nr:extracellular solute-binding protein [Bifidobacterium sp. ESL0682]WEV42383.1 extracellular solute-binding protein [Bifidobacterium sp. ESL0682]
MKITLRRAIRVLLACLCTIGIAGAGAGCGSTGASGSNVVTLSFFQTKPEANEDYDKIIADFEKTHPNIKVVQNEAADAATALRALLVKDRTPDVISINPNGEMGKMAKAGVFYDFSNSPIVPRLKPAQQRILADLGHNGDEVNMLMYAGNVCGLMYNVDLFKKYNVPIPRTWKQLESAAATFESNGIAPFIGTLGDPNRVSTPFDGLAPYYEKDGFWDKMHQEGRHLTPDSPVSFSRNFKPLLQRLYWMYQHTTKDVRTMNYEDGNAAFAEGKGAMILTGNWALAPMLQTNPNLHAKFFPYPADNAKDDILVSGGDVAITMGAHPKHEKESMEFINYLFQKKIQKKFVDDQQLIPSLKDLKANANPALASAEPWIDSGKIIGYADHHIPASISYNPILNKAMLDGNLDSALNTLDNEWRKVEARTIE